MLNPMFVLVTVPIGLVTSASYVRGMMRGQTRPNLVTWLLWTLIPLVTLAAQLADGVGWQSLLTFAAALEASIVVMAVLVRPKAVWRIGVLDLLCGSLSGIGVALWAAFRIGDLAIALSITADGLAACPTIAKASSHPDTEDPVAFGLATLAGAVTLLTVNRWTLSEAGFPIYATLVCGLIFGLTLVGRALRRFRERSM